MINFRYHVVSIIGIFMALAVGVVLGAGPLAAHDQHGHEPLVVCGCLRPAAKRTGRS